MNRYVFVYNNPVKYVDFSGYRAVEVTTIDSHTAYYTQQPTVTTTSDLDEID